MAVKTRRMLAVLLGAAALLATGCGNTCKDAATRVDEKYEECGVTLPDAKDGEEEEPECNDADADSAERSADCIEKATCDEVRSGDWIFNC
jgi:hypothetical protein